MDESGLPTTPPSETMPPTSSLGSRLTNIFAAPGEVFAEVARSKPVNANWSVPLLLYILTGIVAVFIIFSQPAITQQIRDQQRKAFDQQVAAGKLTQQAADQAAAVAERFAGPAMLKIFGSVGMVVIGFVMIFWWALIIWLLGKWFLKSQFAYAKAMEVAGLALMIWVLGNVVNGLLCACLGKQAALGLSLLVVDQPATSLAHAALAAVDVFSIWMALTVASGLARLTGSTYGKAVTLTGTYWVLQEIVIFVVTWLPTALTSAPK